MLDVHYIEFILLKTKTVYQIKHLTPKDQPEADFAVTQPIKTTYEYCKLHGLWMTKA